jgi:hypothetical protein
MTSNEPDVIFARARVHFEPDSVKLDSAADVALCWNCDRSRSSGCGRAGLSGCNGLRADRPPAAPLVIQSTQRQVLGGQGLWLGRAVGE